MAAAYSLSEKAFTEYQEKVTETLGKGKEQKVRDEIEQDRVRANPVGPVVIGDGQVLVYDSYTGRYFNSSVEAIRSAVNEINFQLNHNMYASLSDFYNILGWPCTDISDELGWTNAKLMVVDFSTVLADDGRPAVSIRFRTDPIRDYYKCHA